MGFEPPELRHAILDRARQTLVFQIAIFGTELTSLGGSWVRGQPARGRDYFRSNQTVGFAFVGELERESSADWEIVGGPFEGGFPTDSLGSIMMIKTTSTDYGYFDPSISTLGSQYRQQYNAATPFPHIVLQDFLDESILDLCLREFPSLPNSVASYKRSQENLKFEFKPEVLSPPLRSLFYSFNSIPFVSFMENLTGIKGLIPDPYFGGAGFHQVSQGGHLGIHADFNFHRAMSLERRINVLIYLNKDWREEYGGCLELWDQQMKRCCERVVPAFNTCVVFNTSLTSFHGNPAPVNHPDGQPRRSIALTITPRPGTEPAARAVPNSRYVRSRRTSLISVSGSTRSLRI